MKVYIVCYDLSDDDTRLHVSKALGKYGDRVQKSVFEVRIRSDTELQQLRRELKAIVGGDPEVRMYRLCERCRQESYTLEGEKIAIYPSTIIL